RDVRRGRPYGEAAASEWLGARLPRERHHRAIDGRGAPGRRGLVAQRETEVSAPASARGLSRLRGSPRRPTSTSEVVGAEDDDGVGVASGPGVLQEWAREEV